MDAAPTTDYHSLQYLTNGQTHIVLQAGSFDCIVGTRRALLVNDTGGWKGCWTESEDAFTIVWEDGDTTVVKKKTVRQQPTPARDDDISS